MNKRSGQGGLRDEANARAVNAQPWDPPPGMVKRQCSWCRYLLRHTSGRRRTTLPGLCRLGQPARVSGPEVAAATWAGASPAATAAASSQ